MHPDPFRQTDRRLCPRVTGVLRKSNEKGPPPPRAEKGCFQQYPVQYAVQLAMLAIYAWFAVLQR